MYVHTFLTKYILFEYLIIFSFLARTAYKR